MRPSAIIAIPALLSIATTATATTLEELPLSSVALEADPAPTAKAACRNPLRLRNTNDSDVVVEYVTTHKAGGLGCAGASTVPGSVRLRWAGAAGSTRPLGCPIRPARTPGCREERSWRVTFVGRYG